MQHLPQSREERSPGAPSLRVLCAKLALSMSTERAASTYVCPLSAPLVSSVVKGFPAAIARDQPCTTACRLDMHVQPRQNPLSRSDFYPDQRSERPPVEGTVARGSSTKTPTSTPEKSATIPATSCPSPSPKKSWPAAASASTFSAPPATPASATATASSPPADSPASLPRSTSRACKKRPLGYFYDVITEGFGIMPDYASQIPPQDRWDIVAYVRALQLSQNATMADVPPDRKFPPSRRNSASPDPAQPCRYVAPDTNRSRKQDKQRKTRNDRGARETTRSDAAAGGEEQFRSVR